jgi:hypothetical protein
VEERLKEREREQRFASAGEGRCIVEERLKEREGRDLRLQKGRCIFAFYFGYYAGVSFIQKTL